MTQFGVISRRAFDLHTSDIRKLRSHYRNLTGCSTPFANRVDRKSLVHALLKEQFKEDFDAYEQQCKSWREFDFMFEMMEEQSHKDIHKYKITGDDAYGTEDTEVLI